MLAQKVRPDVNRAYSTPKNIADIEREKALRATPKEITDTQDPVRFGAGTKPITTSSVADEQKALGESRLPKEENIMELPEIYNTETQDTSRFTEGEREGDSGNYDPYAEPEQTGMQKFVGDVKGKINDWVDAQTAKAIGNAAQPETLYDQAGSTLKEADEKGLAASRAIQNAEIPKWKRATINDVLFNPEYEGIRDSIVSQAINARGANFLKGLAGQQGTYESAIDKYNKEQAERYSNAVADRDTRALEAQLQADEAANKRDVGEVLQRADTYLGRELDRWGLLYDTETKKQVLTQMTKDSKEFAALVPDPADRLLLTAYQQYLSGEATALDSIVSVYGPEILEKISPLVDKALGSFGSSNTEKTYPDIKIGDKSYTQGELNTLGWQRIDKLIAELPSLEDQKEVVENFEKTYGNDAWVNNLRNNYDGRVRVQKAQEQLTADSNTYAEDVSEGIKYILDNYAGKDRVGKLTTEKEELDKKIKAGDIIETDAVKTVRATLKNELAKAKLSEDVKGINKPLQNQVNIKNPSKTLNNLAKLGWGSLIASNTGSVSDRAMKLDAVRGTDGYKTVLDFLKDKSVQNSMTKDPTDFKNYYYATKNFLDTFGGTADSYGFYKISEEDIQKAR